MVRSSSVSGGLPLRSVLPDATWQGVTDAHRSDVAITGCTCDSRLVRPGDAFVALDGVTHDGHAFVREALDRGAAAFVVERAVPVDGRPTCLVDDTAVAYGALCQALAGNPARDLRVVGITGTNGKTTCTRLTASVLGAVRGAGANPVGTLGTLGSSDGYDWNPATHTTPPAPVVATWLARAAAAGCRHAVMEVSSHALAQRRIAGVGLRAACLTNVRHDHLDYHGTLAAYRRAKARLFDHLAPDGVAIVNIDDPVARRIAGELEHPTLTVGLDPTADVTARVVERAPGAQTFLLTAGAETVAVETAMIGDHHVGNCLVAAAVGLVEGFELTDVARGLESVTFVPGRLERIEGGQPFATYVDYAHTPDALEVVLGAVRQVTPGRVTCVFGAGGDRDREKRPAMGRVVERLADVAIVTSDNPRGEDPAAIARAIRDGMESHAGVIVELDRAVAICRAIESASEGDAVIVAGKGHESEQIVAGERHHFDDREVVRACLRGIATVAAAP